MATFLDELAATAEPQSVVTDAESMAPYLTDWLGRYNGNAQAVLRPGDTQEAARMVGACRKHRIPISLQGGNTGLVGGSVPDESGRSVLMSTSRMNRIEPASASDRAITAQAGATLADVKLAATNTEMRLPITLGSEGTAQIGGLIGTNAGGSHAMRFGMMRDLVLGFEVVLPDGSVESDLRPLRKNNFGPDLSGIFIGTEGAFGLITAATLTLTEIPKAFATCLLAMPNLKHLPTVLAFAAARFGPGLERAEFMSGAGIKMALDKITTARQPLGNDPPWTLLFEITGADEERTKSELLEFLADMFARELVSDGTIAESLAQSEAFWLLREAVVEGQRLTGPQLKHDVSVRVSDLPRFIDSTTELIEGRFSGSIVNAFGHAGDGNVHFNVSIAQYDAEKDAEISDAIYNAIDSFDGSVAAEHGIGRAKRERYRASTSPAKLAILDALKDRLDPERLFNPHILFEQK